MIWTATLGGISVIQIPSEADIRCSAEKIFDVIIDFRNQDRWLTKSSAFHGTSEISSNPVTMGTTYREPGPFGVRNGTVTEFERPTKITFHQPMTMRLHSGIVDVTMRYTLTPRAESTHVTRVVTLGVPWSLKLVQPLLVRAFRVESGRALHALKAYADNLP
jgi:uncharacterized protein YndB with AHSA1/START domain